MISLGCARPEPKESTPSSTAAPVIEPLAVSAPATSQAAPRPAPQEGPAPCSADRDCAWDDPCLPTRCLGAVAPTAGCGESAPPPGECRCQSGFCTMSRKETPPPVAVGCKKNGDCGFDLTSGACVKKDKYTLWPKGDSYCRCEPSKGECSVEKIAPVPCKSYKDCSWELDPLRAVPSKDTPRPSPKPVKPCSTGEHDSVCTDGLCTIVSWRC